MIADPTPTARTHGMLPIRLQACEVVGDDHRTTDVEVALSKDEPAAIVQQHVGPLSAKVGALPKLTDEQRRQIEKSGYNRKSFRFWRAHTKWLQSATPFAWPWAGMRDEDGNPENGAGFFMSDATVKNMSRSQLRHRPTQITGSGPR